MVRWRVTGKRGSTLTEGERHPKARVGVELSLFARKLGTELVEQSSDEVGGHRERTKGGTHGLHCAERGEEPHSCLVRNLIFSRIRMASDCPGEEVPSLLVQLRRLH